MNIAELTKALAAIQLPADTASPTFHDRLLKAYLHHIKETFAQALASNSLDALNQQVQNNWHLVNGTCLSYTALPDSPITEFLIQAATYVADEKNKRDCGVVRTQYPPKKLEEINFGEFNSVLVRPLKQPELKRGQIPPSTLFSPINKPG